MRDAHPKSPPLALLVTAVVVFTLVVYPLSLGPAAWIANSAWCPQWLDHWLEVIYMPLEWVAENCPAALRETIYAYLEWWIEA